MNVKDVKANRGNIDLVLDIVSKGESRVFRKFGKEGRVCDSTGRDGSGDIMLTLWNDDIELVKVGDKVHLQNGWCSEFQGKLQLSAGKFGKIEVVNSGSQEVFTNSPEMMQGKSLVGKPARGKSALNLEEEGSEDEENDGSDDSDDESPLDIEEEFVD